MFFSTSLVGALAATAALVSAMPTVSITGNKFFTSDGNQWFIKGVAYQLVPEDPLVDTAQCTRDATLMQSLGANTIRVYHVDPNGSHDGCMQAFANVGIYVFVDLDTFTTQIDANNPQWNLTQLSAFERVMDAFHSYDNLAGFFVGNEVITTGDASPAAPYVKAAARDLKAYRDSKGYRKIPVGYSAADIASLRPMLQNYLACGTNSSESIDFFSLNAYEWCGDSTYATSGYATLNSFVQNTGNGQYSVPIFFSETGCIIPPPRTFADQSSILGTMSAIWSGSIIYEWIEEANDYGLISYGPKVDPSSPDAPPDGFTRSGTPTPISPDFQNLQNQWKTLTPTGVQLAAYTPTLTPPPCPSSTPGVWEVNGNPPLPLASGTVAAAKGASSTGMITPSLTNIGAGTSTATTGLVSTVTSLTSSTAASTSSTSSTAASTTFSSLTTAAPIVVVSAPSSSGTNASSSYSLSPTYSLSPNASDTNGVNGSTGQTAQSGAAPSASATATHAHGAASPAKEIYGGAVGLVGVMVGFLWFL